MRLVKSALVVLFVLGLIVNAQAKPKAQKKISYQGQTGESFELDMIEEILRYRTEMQDSTCTRRVPYQDQECRTDTTYEQECQTVPGETQCQTTYETECRTEYERECRTEYENVCRNETRYRRECHEERGQRRCHTENERVCENVTRYREECSTGPMRQKCHQEPGRRQCRTLPNGKERCRDIPGRKVCEKIPGERTCRQVAYQDQKCRNVPRERCSFDPPRQVCNDVPYTDRVCEDEARQVCDNVPRQRCEDVPRQSCTTSDDRVVCEDVPRYNEVCEDVTRYRDENYTCQKEVQVPYTVKVPVKAIVDILFEDMTASEDLAFDLKFKLDKTGDVKSKLKSEEELPVLISETKEIEVDDQEKSRESKVKLSYQMVDREKALKAVTTEMGKLVLRKRSLIVGSLETSEGADVSYFLTISTKVMSKPEKEGEEPVEEDKILIAKKLDSMEFSIFEKNEKKKMLINLARLEFKPEAETEYDVSIVTRVELPGVMNLGDSKLESVKEAKILMKVEKGMPLSLL